METQKQKQMFMAEEIKKGILKLKKSYTKDREQLIELLGEYKMKWLEYPHQCEEIGSGTKHPIKYMIQEVC